MTFSFQCTTGTGSTTGEEISIVSADNASWFHVQDIMKIIDKIIHREFAVLKIEKYKGNMPQRTGICSLEGWLTSFNDVSTRWPGVELVNDSMKVPITKRHTLLHSRMLQVQFKGTLNEYWIWGIHIQRPEKDYCPIFKISESNGPSIFKVIFNF